MDFDSLWRKKQAGKKAQAYGALFEQIFLEHCRARMIVATRFPDGCKQYGTNKLYRVPTPWDYILTHKGRSAFIDTKTVQTRTFVHSQIQDHQVLEMFRHESEGAVAGYVIWFRETDRVIFMGVSELLELMKFRGSITDKHPKAIDLGSVNGDGGMRILDIFTNREGSVKPSA